MRVSHRSGVDAALQDAGGKAADAADIGADGYIFRSVELFLIQIIQIELRIHLGGVDTSAVLALDDGAVVLSGNAAHIVFSGDGTGEAAVDDLPLRLVDARDPADAVRPADRAGKCAVCDGAPVFPGQAA